MKTKRSRHDRERGLTLVELAITVLILSLTVGIITMSFGTSFRVWKSSSHSREVDRRANRGLDRILEALEYASSETVAPDLGEHESSCYIEFQPTTGSVDGKQQLGPKVRIEWLRDPLDPEDGVDNNGNGLVDEGLVVRREDPGGEDEIRVVLLRSVGNLLEGEEPNGEDDNANGLVDEKGLCFERDGSILKIRLTLLHDSGEGGVIAWTGEGHVALGE